MDIGIYRDIDKIEVGKRLLQLRKSCGISRDTIALKSDIAVKTIQNWEAGKKELRLHNLARYLRAFELLGCYTSLDWILQGKNGADAAIIKSNICASMEIVEAVEIFKKTSNLFYYLDEQELVWYVNRNWLYCLNDNDHYSSDESYENDPSANNKDGESDKKGKKDESVPDIRHGTPFRKLCSSGVYRVCHEAFLQCLEGQAPSFSYHINNESDKPLTEVVMLYMPVKAAKNSKIIGVFAFLSSQNSRHISQL